MVADIFPEFSDAPTPTTVPTGPSQFVPGGTGYRDEAVVGQRPWGTATVRREGDKLHVLHADPIIAIAPELLCDSDAYTLPVDVLGYILLAGDPRYRYRPIKFAREGSALLVICKRAVGHAID